ncbi:hypothetical protein WR25_27317 [Diploscapter pachys]|uniref:Uncharacterized protein n=1 Tax=Diploscapter pachys TaxID=2018661 RepID=A0A2A2KAH1_9BILA|nr:hypothetical protein WR25_27317 [Diploscapter pachys]
MILVAASMSLAFRSFILVWAISASLLRAILPATTLPGSFEPDFRPAAFLIRNDAGGVLISKLNERLAVQTGQAPPASIPAMRVEARALTRKGARGQGGGRYGPPGGHDRGELYEAIGVSVVRHPGLEPGSRFFLLSWIQRNSGSRPR